MVVDVIESASIALACEIGIMTPATSACTPAPPTAGSRSTAPRIRQVTATRRDATAAATPGGTLGTEGTEGTGGTVAASPLVCVFDTYENVSSRPMSLLASPSIILVARS